MILLQIGLCYQRTIWRCSIKRMNLDNNLSLFYSENLTYGNILNIPITYKYNLLKELNEYFYSYNEKTYSQIDWNDQFSKTFYVPYRIESSMFSVASTYTYRYSLKIFNVEKIKKDYCQLSNAQRSRIIFYCAKMIELFTNDVISLMKICKDDNIKVNINNNESNFIIDDYFNKHFIIENYKNTFRFLKTICLDKHSKNK